MMLEDASDDVKGHFKEIGKAIEDAYVGRELALAIALDALELAEEDVTMERVRAKCKEGAMLYEVKLVAGNMEYEVIIDAKTGDVLKTESEEFEEFDPKAEIDEFCGKHDVNFDDIKDKINDAFDKHDHEGEGDHKGEENPESRPLTKGEILKGF